MAEAPTEPTPPTPPPEAGKGKKGKTKKPKLTKAERRARRLLEAMRLKERLIREQLQRELAMSKKSLVRGKPIWEEICREVKIKEMRQELIEWSEMTQFLLEKKDEKIEALLNTLAETQEIYERCFVQHLEQLEYLTRCHKTLLAAATALYEENVSFYIGDFLLEMFNMESRNDKIKSNTENKVLSSNIVTKERLKKNYENFLEQKFDEATRQIETRYILRDATVRKMKELQTQLLVWMRELEGDMIDVHKTERFLYFMERQRNYVIESQKLNDIERKSHRAIADLEQEYLNIEAESTRRIYTLKLEQTYFQEVRTLIKKSIEKDKFLTHQKLLAVSSESYRVIKELKEIVKRGELLLNLGVCCRKYMTEKEKVLPLKKNGDEEELVFKMSIDMHKLLDTTEEELADELELLKFFWRRFANIQFHNILLNQEKDKNLSENEEYRNIIRSLKKSDDVAYILECLQINPIEF